MTTRSWGLLLLTPFLLAAVPHQNPEPVRVTGLSLAPAEGEAELVVATRGGPVRWSDFTLENPFRVVLDIEGARSDLAQASFDNIDRAAIASVRTSQYSADVVRVVVDLERPVRYSVTSDVEGLRVRLAVAEAFAPWSSGSNGSYAASVRTELPQGRAPEPLPVQAQQAPITVNFQEADIRDVLASFAEFTGRSIVPGSGVEGKVTASIREQPWDVALQTILGAYGLAAQEMPSGIIQVDRLENLQARMTQEPVATRTFRINYVPVQEIQESLQSLTSERGKISFNSTTNTLIVTDVPSVLERIDQMVQQLDVRTPQVTIEAKIVFVNRTQAEELGIIYDLKDSRGNSLNRIHPAPDPQDPTQSTHDNLVLLSGNSIAALGNANSRVQGPQLETLVSLVLGRFTLVSFLEALQLAELSDVQAAPVVTTLDNQQAEIWVGERTPIRVVDLASTGAAGGGGGGTTVTAPRATAELVDTGIRLRVTPHITADRRILMEMHAERSSAQLAATDIGVIFQTQQGETRVMVNDGETAVIGGLTVTEVTNTQSGIPYLMNIPFIGRLFRTERKREQKRDLLIMVTPHIVDDASLAQL
ncbi:MAG TPA: AMIN domain-containing protein [Longimicrobiaceae bacterium]